MKKFIAASAALCLALGAAQVCMADGENITIPSGSALTYAGTVIYIEDYDGPFNVVEPVPSFRDRITGPGPVIVGTPESVPAVKVEPIVNSNAPKYLLDLFAK